MRSYLNNTAKIPSEIIGNALGKNKHMTQLTDAAIADYWASLKPNDKGLVPVVTTDASTNEVLMMAWMNEEAFTKTLETKSANYFSRSRNKLWLKGEESGNTQKVVEIRIDCDADTVLLKVEQKGVACHTGNKTCFDGVLVWSEK
jgi:phosphoribosyl-AMP cyclohydrolase